MLIYLSLLESEDDKNSFERIYEENYLKMYHIAFGILKQQADAENAVHEAFLSLAERFEKYSELSCREMTGLCVTIVKNKAIDIIRMQKHLSEDELENLVLCDPNEKAEPAAYLEQKEETERLQKIMQKLPETLKITLDLKYFYGYSNQEIAKILGIPQKTVEMRLYRGKIKLRELLESERTDG